MEINADKVDEMVLALLYLNFEKHRNGVRAWKTLSWFSMNRLYDKGFVSDPRSKAKSVAMTEEGERRAKELFERHFSA